MEIKFRLIDKFGNIVGYEKWFVKNNRQLWLYSKNNKDWAHNKIKHNYKDRFVGITDTKGNEIFENDFIKCFHFIDRRGKTNYLEHLVKWSNYYKSWYCINIRNISYNDENLDGNIQLWVYLKNVENKFEKIQYTKKGV